MTINLVLKVAVARQVCVRKRRTLAPSKEQRDEKESQKMGGGENP